MSRVQTLKNVARFESTSKSQLLSDLSAAKANLEEQVRLAEQLEEYMTDYARLNQPSSEPQNAWRLSNGSRFAGDLYNTMKVQVERRREAELKFEDAKARWASFRARQRSIEGLIDEATQIEQKELQNSEDKEQEDQWSSTSNFRRLAETR